VELRPFPLTSKRSQIKGDLNLLNRFLQALARRFGYVVVLESLPPEPDKGMEGSKLDYKYLDRLATLIEEFTGTIPTSFFEVGANFAQDAAYLAKKWQLSSGNVVVFEPHPLIVEKVRNRYDFLVVPKAVSNVNGRLQFNAVKLENTSNSGISSLLPHIVNDEADNDLIEVEVIRLDDFAAANSWAKIDFLKIDVEGLTYEVLEGLGNFLENVGCIQIETEYIAVWKDQRTQSEVYKLLEENHFQLIDHFTQMDGVQSDSLWIREDLVIHKIYDLSHKQWVTK